MKSYAMSIRMNNGRNFRDDVENWMLDATDRKELAQLSFNRGSFNYKKSSMMQMRKRNLTMREDSDNLYSRENIYRNLSGKI